MIGVKRLAAALAAGLMAAAGQAAPQHDYAVGQVWAYHNRPQDAGSLLKIERIEDGAGGGQGERIFHIAVVGVHLTPGCPGVPIGHLPVARQTLDASVTTRVTTDLIFPDVSDGVDEWRRANGGVFTIPLDKIMDDVGSIAGPSSPAPHQP